jgi:hypothetical protein
MGGLALSLNGLGKLDFAKEKESEAVKPTESA